MKPEEKSFIDAVKKFLQDDTFSYLHDDIDEAKTIDDFKKLIDRAKAHVESYVSDANYFCDLFYNVKTK